MYSWISLVTSSITALKYIIGASVYCTVCITVSVYFRAVVVWFDYV